MDWKFLETGFTKRESLKIGSLKNKERYFPFLNIRGLFNRKKSPNKSLE